MSNHTVDCEWCGQDMRATGYTLDHERDCEARPKSPSDKVTELPNPTPAEKRLLDCIDFLKTKPAEQELLDYVEQSDKVTELPSLIIFDEIGPPPDFVLQLDEEIMAEIRERFHTTGIITELEWQAAFAGRSIVTELPSEQLTPAEAARVTAAIMLEKEQEMSTDKYPEKMDCPIHGPGEGPFNPEGNYDYTQEEKEGMFAQETENRRGEQSRADPFEIHEANEVLTTFQVRDISSEVVRKYLYPDGEVVLDAPDRVFIAASGSHRIVGMDGWVTYLPAGWKAIQWLPVNPELPVAF
jgi:hypothetical protein